MVRVINVKVLDDYHLELLFDNGETKIFDVKPYMDKGLFKELYDVNIFKTVKVNYGTIEWCNGVDFCPDTLYQESKDRLNN